MRSRKYNLAEKIIREKDKYVKQRDCEDNNGKI